MMNNNSKTVKYWCDKCSCVVEVDKGQPSVCPTCKTPMRQIQVGIVTK